MKILLSGLAASLLVLGAMLPANASISATVEWSAAELAEIRGYLEGDDENKAVAAMAMFLDSENPLFRQMAIDYGLKHSKPYIRAAAFEKVIRSSRTLQFEFESSDNYTPAQTELFKKNGGGMAFRTKIYSNSFEGTFPSLPGSTENDITVTGTTVHINNKGCGGRFSLEGVEAVGNFICGEASIPARVKLY